MASIAKYLVHIAQERDASRTHYESPESARKQMTDYGLSTAQQETVLRADPNEINAEIAREIGTQTGLTVYYNALIVHGPGGGP
jgi:hypothetical protein